MCPNLQIWSYLLKKFLIENFIFCAVSPVTSSNLAISPQNFLAFSLHPFATLVQSFKATSSASPKLMNWNQEHSSKKLVYLAKYL